MPFFLSCPPCSYLHYALVNLISSQPSDLVPLPQALSFDLFWGGVGVGGMSEKLSQVRKWMDDLGGEGLCPRATGSMTTALPRWRKTKRWIGG